MGGPAKSVFGLDKAVSRGEVKKVEPQQKKSEEQPKVEAQMDNSVAGPAGPTNVELDTVVNREAKRKGRRYSILTSSLGLESKPTLSKKTLLG